MNKYFVLSVVGCLTLCFVSACETAVFGNKYSEASYSCYANSPTRPAWANANSRVNSDREYDEVFTGSSNNAKSENEALVLAIHNVLMEVIMSRAGAHVMCKQEDIQSVINGIDSESVTIHCTITGIPVEVRYFRIEDKYPECHYEKNRKEWDMSVLISIPKAELARIRRKAEEIWKKIDDDKRKETIMANGLTVCSLKSNVSECANVLQLLPPLNVNGSKLRIPNKCMDIDKSVDEISKEFNDVAYLMKIECEYRDPNMSPATPGFIYSQINLKIDIVNVFDGTNVLSINAQREGGGYSLKDSIDDAVEEAVEELKDKYKENFE